MRIVAFVGSPVLLDDKELVKLAKRLKKEKVNVDIISFGEETVNNDVLTAFINALNGKDGTGSHLVTVPPGPHLSDALISSPIIQGEDGMGGAGMGGAAFEFGVDRSSFSSLVSFLLGFFLANVEEFIILFLDCTLDGLVSTIKQTIAVIFVEHACVSVSKTHSFLYVLIELVFLPFVASFHRRLSEPHRNLFTFQLNLFPCNETLESKILTRNLFFSLIFPFPLFSFT